MKMRIVGLALLALVGGLLLNVRAEEKDNEALVRALKEADVVFTGKIGKSKALGQTNSIPASIFGEITFLEPKTMRGAMPEVAKFSYSYREGAKHMEVMAEGQVLVALKGKGVTAIVPATEANLALAKKVLEGVKEKKE